MNNASVNVLALHICVSFSRVYNQGGCWVRWYQLYLAMPNYLPKEMYQFTFPVSPALVFVYLKKKFYSRYIVVSSWEFNLLITIEIEHHFILLVIWISSFGDCLLKFSVHFCMGLVLFFLTVLWNSLYFYSLVTKYFWNSLFFSCVYNCNISPQFGLSFYLLYSVLMNRSS